MTTGKSTTIRYRDLAFTAMLYGGLATGVVAQTSAPTRQDGGSPAEIVASGVGEVSSLPTKANFEVEVKTLAPTAAAASAENARLSRAVTDALRAAGIQPEELESSQLSVGANWNFEESSHRQKRTAYQAINRIQIQTDQLEKVGIYVDAALSAGGTGTTTPVFLAKDPAGMRRQALTEAVAAARRDAEAMAQAGGGRLGDLELVTTEQPESVFGERMDRMFKKSVGPDEPSEIVIPKITVSARVIARWRFLASSTGR